MTEVLSYGGEILGKWPDMFREYANNPETEVAGWVEQGVDMGVADDTDAGRTILARQMGAIFSYVYDEETGAEKLIEDVDPQIVESETGIDSKRFEEVSSFMVNLGIVNSREKIEANRRKKNSF
mgnify:CR=1 FL=1